MPEAPRLDAFDLTGRVAVVTGASKGIGEAMARALTAAGAHVVVTSRKAESVEAVAASIRETGGTATGQALHVGRDAAADALGEIAAEAGGLDILVNNAAANPVYGAVEETSESAYDKIMDVNVKGAFLLARAALPHFKEAGGGSVINVSSIGGVKPETGLGIYSVSKAALISLTEVLAKEWGRHGIRANAICPGLIKTSFSKALWDDEATRERFTNHLPLGRIGQPEDLAALAVFLASEASAYCTGSVFTADGGFLIS